MNLFFQMAEVCKESVLILGILNIVIALFFLVWPDVFLKLNKALNRWFSIEKLEEALNKARDIDGHVMKARKVIGCTSIALAAVLLFLYFKM